jgi:hypothetical protein
MKVNKITALRLMLSITMIIVLPVVVKIKFKKCVRATGWNVDSKKASSSKNKWLDLD